MSSWRSGRVISRTASPSGPGPPPPPATRGAHERPRPRAMASRRRLILARERVARATRAGGVGGSWGRFESRKYAATATLLQLVERAVVAHRVSPLAAPSPAARAGGRLALAPPPRARARRPARSRTASSATPRSWRRRRGLHPGLEQQRHLHHGGRGAGRAPPPPARHSATRCAHPRPQQALEPGARLVVAEDALRDQRRGRSRRPARPRARAAPRRCRALVGGQQLVDHRVGRERRRAQLGERRQRLRLARAQTSGQPDEGDPGAPSSST